MKKLITLAIATLLNFFSNLKAEIMERGLINQLKGAAFDSYDEDEDDDNYDSEDDDNYDPDGSGSNNFRGARKRKPKMQGRQLASVSSGFSPNSGTFTITVTNAMAAVQTVELFNSLSSISLAVNNANFAGYSPFTAVNRNVATLINTIAFNAAGDLVITNAAGEVCTIVCKQIPYVVLLNTLQFYRIKLKNFRFTYLQDTSLDNDLVYSQKTFLGMSNVNPLTPRTYFADNQFQTKQVTISESLVFDGERGLTFPVAIGETLSFNFNLSGIQKF